MMVLKEKDLWDIVPEVEKWKGEGDAAEQSRYTKRQKKEFAIVCLSLENSQLSMVRSWKTAAEASKRVEDHYEK
ncbi:hypothetical protein LEN26_001630 [Aphanomyces euteiches]|nr:hypothetical protein AeMF1_005732 [Aphanomyces euteiches]KAH9149922.1 hypothetical protein LEN26_004139 [Aphanomyces euteiches]KAH9160988.1 hypothetical protein LEN26_001630 [Aphanomyces euteiches]KAH9186529.1 hypothetical protein AeNC1_011496 [Aphanomyces euteiches]